MRKKPVPLWILPLLLLLAAAAWLRVPKPEPDRPPWTVTASRFENWTPLAGKLEARNPVTLRSEMDGLAKITWLIEDGTPVFTGDVVARFDPAELEDQKLTLTRDLEMARAELKALTDAKHPLELQRLQREQSALELQLQEEVTRQADTAELVKENLLSKEDLSQHKIRIQGLESEITALKNQITLTREVLQPALEKQAAARLHAAATALKRVEERLANTEVKAPVDGSVYLPRIPIDGRRRSPRVGDGLYRNQVFMQLADLRELDVQSGIPEQQLSRIVPGLQARIRFPAYPEKTYAALVRKVGAHPEGDSGLYPVTLQLNERHPDFRPGLSAEIEVLESVSDSALMLPRHLIHYADGKATVTVRAEDGQREHRTLTLGPGTPGAVRVTAGLREGETVLAP